MKLPTWYAITLALSQSVSAWKYGSCTADEQKKIDHWMEETLYLYGRGSMVLQEAIKEKKAKGAMDKSYQEILDAILGPGRTVADYEAVNEIMFNLARDTRSADLVIWCQSPYVDSHDFPVASDGKPQLIHQVYISRTKADVNNPMLKKRMASPKYKAYFSSMDGRSMNVLNMKASRSDKEAYAMMMSGGKTSFYNYQEKVLHPDPSTPATSGDWSDLVLLKLWESTWKDKLAQDGTEKPADRLTFFSNDWTPSNSRFPKIKSDHMVFATTFMHELAHSHIARSRPDISHAKVGTHSANRLGAVLEVAARNNREPLENVGTYVHLAFCLSTPWLKFWDRTANPPKFDGVVRWNPSQEDEKKRPLIKIPSAIHPEGKRYLYTTEKELTKGAYAWKAHSVDLNTKLPAKNTAIQQRFRQESETWLAANAAVIG